MKFSLTSNSTSNRKKLLHSVIHGCTDFKEWLNSDLRQK